MTKIVGKVQVVGYNETSGYYSLKVDGVYYSAGKKRPDVNNGQTVEFEGESVERGGRTYWNLKAGTLKVVESQEKSAPPKGTGATRTTGAGSNSAYWEAKEQRDIEVTQPRIAYQAARNSALELVSILSAEKAIVYPAPKKGATDLKPGERLEVIEKLVEGYTEKFFLDTQMIGAPEETQPDTTAESSDTSADGDDA